MAAKEYRATRSSRTTYNCRIAEVGGGEVAGIQYKRMTDQGTITMNSSRTSHFVANKLMSKTWNMLKDGVDRKNAAGNVIMRAVKEKRFHRRTAIYEINEDGSVGARYVLNSKKLASKHFVLYEDPSNEAPVEEAEDGDEGDEEPENDDYETAEDGTGEAVQEEEAEEEEEEGEEKGPEVTEHGVVLANFVSDGLIKLGTTLAFEKEVPETLVAFAWFLANMMNRQERASHFCSSYFACLVAPSSSPYI